MRAVSPPKKLAPESSQTAKNFSITYRRVTDAEGPIPILDKLTPPKPYRVFAAVQMAPAPPLTESEIQEIRRWAGPKLSADNLATIENARLLFARFTRAIRHGISYSELHAKIKSVQRSAETLKILLDEHSDANIALWNRIRDVAEPAFYAPDELYGPIAKLLPKADAALATIEKEMGSSNGLSVSPFRSFIGSLREIFVDLGIDVHAPNPPDGEHFTPSRFQGFAWAVYETLPTDVKHYRRCSSAFVGAVARACKTKSKFRS